MTASSVNLTAVSKPEHRGHVFISYVREDSERAESLVQALVGSGINVWHDVTSLLPGQDWKAEIRQAINEDAAIFLACFSKSSVARSVSYQWEELVLAAQRMRVTAPGRAWMIPVRFDECEVPDLDLGAGRSLSSLQRADLFGDSWEEATAHLVESIWRDLNPVTDGGDWRNAIFLAGRTASIPTVVELGQQLPWFSQWAIVREQLEAVEASILEKNDRHVRRELDNFFTQCFHLGDWIWEDKSTGIDEKTVRAFIANDPSIRICAGIANTSKHRVRSRPNAITAWVSTAPSDAHGGIFARVQWMEMGNGWMGDALVLARNCITAWERFLRAYGLEPPV